MYTLIQKTKLVKNSTSMDNAIWALFAGMELLDNSISLAQFIKMLIMQQMENLS